MVIDIHPHVISEDTERYPHAPVGGHKSDWSQKRPVTVDQLLASMDAAGVDKAALVQASTCYGHDNSYVADCVAAYPERFTGVFSADVLAPDAPDKIRYWLGRNLSGLRLFTTGTTMPGQADWIDDPRSFPAWQCCSELGVPVCMQMTAKGIPLLERILDRFPAIRVVLDHLARPSLEDGPPYLAASELLALSRYPNVYLKLTPRTFEEVRRGKATPESFFPLLVEKFGAARLAWGSNFPASEGALSSILELSRNSLPMLSEDDREWIFSRTALNLYPRLAR